jgi:hypothetical protein
VDGDYDADCGDFERYGYDAAGNRTSITHPDGTWFGMWHDGLGRQYYLHANNALGMAMLYFAPHGGVSALGRPGIASWIGYDAVQRPSTLAHTAYTPAASTDVAFSYTRNPASQIAGVTRDNDAYAWGGHYGVQRAYTTNGLNQYSAAGNASFLYDLNGKLTSDGATNYVYDAENRLVSASGAHNATLVYDPLGRLYQVTSGAGAVTRFLYDGDVMPPPRREEQAILVAYREARDRFRYSQDIRKPPPRVQDRGEAVGAFPFSLGRK